MIIRLDRVIRRVAWNYNLQNPTFEQHATKWRNWNVPGAFRPNLSLMFEACQHSRWTLAPWTRTMGWGRETNTDKLSFSVGSLWLFCLNGMRYQQELSILLFKCQIYHNSEFLFSYALGPKTVNIYIILREEE